MTDPKVYARALGDALLEASEPRSWWWLSFADSTLPKGSQFLGVAIVEASGMTSAVLEAHRRGINHGGAVKCIQIPPEHVPSPEYRNRLLTREEAEAAGAA
jgi:hypothetical protein